MSRSAIYQPDAVCVCDKIFEPLISAEEIHDAVLRLAGELARDFAARNPLFVVVLNGAFIFAADLIRASRIDQEILFVRVSSYQNMQSTGTVREVLGLTRDVQGREIIVIEDIVDSGHTISYLDRTLREKGATDVTFASLLFKEEAYLYDIPIRYVGFMIPNRFVIGCGLDYNGLGRALDSVYVLKE